MSRSCWWRSQRGAHGLEHAQHVALLVSALACSSAEPPDNGGSTASGATAIGGANPGGAGAAAGGLGSSSAGGVGGTGFGGALGDGGSSPSTAGSSSSGGTAGSSGGTAGSISGTAGSGSGAAGSGSGAGSPGVRLVGRRSPVGTAARFGWPGVALEARFKGTRATIQLDDGNHQNAFEVVIDDRPPTKLRTTAGETSYPIATGLADGEHRILVWKSTEVFDTGNTDYLGLGDFGAGGELLPPPPAPERRIEVIGDSISVGAGLEGGAANCGANKSSTDNYYAYGSVAARALGADISTIAYSGIGVYRSYGGADLTMPQRYDRALPSVDGAWDFSQYQPHVVVITLGTNDFGSGNPGRAFVDAYVSFAKHVRSKYPSAYLMLAAMYGNQEGPIGDVASELKSGGETKVATLTFSSVQNNKGCAQHPDKSAQQAMGELLTTRIKAVMSW
ncbi:MAG: hypothetical protein EOO73_11725 [Myxococcales bacterium]|nr:MAG: hypothetical protein EOO73_11725 [Myxococcales bacterium]